MDSFHSLKKNEDFGRVYRQGRSYGNRLLVMYIFERGRDPLVRIGFSVSKKVGNSVVRHRIKRQLREIMRINAEKLITGIDVVIVAKKEAAGRTYKELDGAVWHLARHLFVLSEKGCKP